MKDETKKKFKNYALLTGGILGISGALLGGIEGISCARSSEINKNPSSYMDSINLNKMNLLADDSFRIIKTTNKMDGENFYFAKKISLLDIAEQTELVHVFANNEVYYKYSDGKSFKKYAKDSYRWSDTYIYIDLETSNVVSVNYYKEDVHIFKDNETTIEYCLNEIISDDKAIDYANSYYGKGDVYSINDMEEVVAQLRTNNKSKTKKLIK